jgi:N6-adenosine-specific RNA methylase IME4
MNSENIKLAHIDVLPNHRLRAIRDELVTKLAESMEKRGLLQPITVGLGSDRGYSLVCGWHRLEAAKRLGWSTIAATFTDLDDDEAELAGIDENLIRGELSPAERAMHVRRRKELYEKLHPETKHGATGRGRKKSRQLGDSNDRFTKDTTKTGQSERDVQRDATRAKSVVVLSEIIRTSLDQGTELDALAKLPPDEQRNLAKRAKAGEKVSAKHHVKKIKREQHEVDLGAKIAAMPDKKYGVIYAEPPWESGVYNEDTGSDGAASNDYATMDLEAIKRLRIPAAEDAVLFLRATVPILPRALEVMAAWGFTYKSNLVWVKDKADTGYWSQIQHEHLLIGVRGSVPAPAPGDLVASVIVSNDGMMADPRKEGIPLFLQVQNRRAGHSAKPAAFRVLIETMYPHLPRIELFAREDVEGWDAWGKENEVLGTLRTVS